MIRPGIYICIYLLTNWFLLCIQSLLIIKVTFVNCFCVNKLDDKSNKTCPWLKV